MERSDRGFLSFTSVQPVFDGIRRWRREQQLRKTLANRPDLLKNAVLGKEDRRLLDTIRNEAMPGSD